MNKNGKRQAKKNYVSGILYDIFQDEGKRAGGNIICPLYTYNFCFTGLNLLT